MRTVLSVYLQTWTLIVNICILASTICYTLTYIPLDVKFNIIENDLTGFSLNIAKIFSATMSNTMIDTIRSILSTWFTFKANFCYRLPKFVQPNIVFVEDPPYILYLRALCFILAFFFLDFGARCQIHHHKSRYPSIHKMD